MDKIKKGLGRGLSSLIGETKVESQKNHLSISDLIPNKYQPRKIFDESNLKELTNSIKERGIIQPIVVRNQKDNNSKFEIIAGERRWLAARKAGLHDIPAVVTEADDLNSLLYSGEDDMGMISKLQEPIGVSLSNIRHSNISNIRNSEKSSCVLPFGIIYEIITCVNEEVKKKLYQIIIDF